MWKPFFVGAVSAVLINFGANAQEAEGPLVSSMEAYVVSYDQDGEEALEPTENVKPGETIEYQLTYENIGANPLSELVISAPIPANTVFIKDTEATEAKSVFEVSVDNGASWHQLPLLKEVSGETVEVSAAEFDLVRWRPSEEIATGEAWEFSYRVSVQ